MRDILNFIGSSAGINVTYDQAFQDKAYSIDARRRHRRGGAAADHVGQPAVLQGRSTRRRSSSINDRADKRQQYDEMVVKVFYVSHADAQELAQLVNTIMRVPQMPVPPVIMRRTRRRTPSPSRGTTQVVDIIERIIRANDKPRAEVVIDVQILEVNRAAREAVRPEPERLRARPDVLAGGGAAEHQRAADRRRRRRRRRST